MAPRRDTQKPYGWAFLGAGAHTIATMIRVHIAQGHSSGDIVVIDPLEPFEGFTRAAANIGMEHMRSSWQVSVVDDPRHLAEFACEISRQKLPVHPSVSMVRDHAVAQWRDMKPFKHLNRRVVATKFNDGLWTLTLDDGSEVKATYVVANFGQSIHRRPLLAGTIGVPEHAMPETLTGRVAIIGAGMTASHVAETAIKRGAQHVVICAPRGIVAGEFDAPQQFIWGECTEYGCTASCTGTEAAIAAFRRRNLTERITLLGHEIFRGTVNEERRQALSQLMFSGRASIHIGRVREVSANDGGSTLHLEDGSSQGGFATVFDARGYDPRVENLNRAIPGFSQFITEPVDDGRYFLGDSKTTMAGPNLWVGGPLDAVNRGPAASTIAGGVALGRDLGRLINQRIISVHA